ncbi:MAG: hypothetical protein ACI9J2_000164 [Saprospiraceae bacterium]|jgi:uncharacterized protein YcnI
MKNIRVLFIIFIAGFLTACSGVKTVPIKVQSSPLGSYVTYQMQVPTEGSNDWLFLGKTPIDIKRRVSKKQYKKASLIRLRVMKEGYSEQIRDWTREEIEEDIDSKGSVFWNPKLVPSQ